MRKILLATAALCALPSLALAETVESATPVVPEATALAIVEQPRQTSRIVTLPLNTLVEVTPAEEITSKKMKEGTTRPFLVTRDVVEHGVVIIPRGAPVTAEVSWRTGKGIVGKSAKFELTFKSVRVGGMERLLRGMHRQEGRGNTAGALLGATFITGKSATMVPGQLVNVFTAEDISVTVPVPAEDVVQSTTD